MGKEFASHEVDGFDLSNPYGHKSPVRTDSRVQSQKQVLITARCGTKPKSKQIKEINPNSRVKGHQGRSNFLSFIQRKFSMLFPLFTNLLLILSKVISDMDLSLSLL